MRISWRTVMMLADMGDLDAQRTLRLGDLAAGPAGFVHGRVRSEGGLLRWSTSLV